MKHLQTIIYFCLFLYFCIEQGIIDGNGKSTHDDCHVDRQLHEGLRHVRIKDVGCMHRTKGLRRQTKGTFQRARCEQLYSVVYAGGRREFSFVFHGDLVVAAQYTSISIHSCQSLGTKWRKRLLLLRFLSPLYEMRSTQLKELFVKDYLNAYVYSTRVGPSHEYDISGVLFKIPTSPWLVVAKLNAFKLFVPRLANETVRTEKHVSRLVFHWFNICDSITSGILRGGTRNTINPLTKRDELARISERIFVNE